jgi:hypothetical protein
LREACGNPPYRSLHRYAGIAPQRLSEAARGEKLPSWLVVERYVHGCLAYHRHTGQDQASLDGAGDPARWWQLYRDVTDSWPGDSERGGTGKAPVSRPGTFQLPRPARVRPIRAAAARVDRRWLAAGAAITGAALLIGGIVLGTSISSGRRTIAAAPAPAARLVVSTPAPSCGRAGSDGLRSPAATAFSSIRSVYTLRLDGLTASVITGTYHGSRYDWLEAHPTGSRAGIQLRWSNARGKWYYCTATLEAGDISALPDLVATTAVPATVEGRRVIYQACVWHQHPYTAQCSPAGV